MSRFISLGRSLCFAALAVIGPSSVAVAQEVRRQIVNAPSTTTVVPAAQPEPAVLQALQSNPYTAPYRISATMQGGLLVLSGRVGTHKVHDVAVQIGLASGHRVRDDLVIDTLAAHQAAASQPAPGGSLIARATPSPGASSYTLGNQPYVYPPPLFGRLDDPFFGFEPPLVSYAPWWPATAARQPIRLPAPGLVVAPVPAGPFPQGSIDPATGPAAPVQPGQAQASAAIEMTLDARGVAVLRGTVPTLADRIAVGQKIAREPGITEVVNLLTVGRADVSDVPPPPPTPFVPANGKPPGAPDAVQRIGPGVPRPGIAVDAGDLGPRITEALARKPSLAGLPVRVTVRDGVATLTGKVPTVYEAMLAFRAVQQTPGVREVNDQLEFVVPEEAHRNPLVQKGRPEDVEPYLAAQIRQQLGDVAHVDSVRLRGDSLEIRGAVARVDDRPRLDAILRSMPVLRGFQLLPTFVAE